MNPDQPRRDISDARVLKLSFALCAACLVACLLAVWLAPPPNGPVRDLGWPGAVLGVAAGYMWPITYFAIVATAVTGFLAYRAGRAK